MFLCPARRKHPVRYNHAVWAMMSDDEDSDTYHLPGQGSWGPLPYLAGLFPRLPSLISLNLLAINVDHSRVLRNYFQSHVNGFIGIARNGRRAVAYNQETHVRPATPSSSSAPATTPNSRAEFEIYYDQLLLRKRGCPVYCPGPNEDLPVQYRKTGCRIGDIGILRNDGSFDYLFNILCTKYHPINRGRVPQGFVPAVIRRDVAGGQALDAGGVLANSCMRERNSTDVGLDADLIFETETEIAVLVLPGGSKFQNLLSSGCLKKYIATHAGQWYSYILEECGRMDVRNGDVRLIIGCDKAPSWGIATRARSQKPGRFGFKRSALSGNFGAQWFCPEGIGNGKFGPLENEMEGLRRSTDPPLDNQTVFIRSMNFTLAGEISNYPDSAALHVLPSTSTTEDSVSFQGNSPLRPASSSNRPPSSVEGPQVGHQSGVVFLPAHFELPAEHPSTYLHQFLMDKFPNAKIAITDDWDWMSVIREDDLIFPTSRDLCQRILESSKVSEENGIATILRSTPSIGRDPTMGDLRDDALSILSTQCAFSALVDSVERIPHPRCAPSTRRAITMKIEKWAKSTSSDTSEIFWLTGGAGAGKSAVTQSVTEVCKQEGILAASFFFNNASNNGASLIPTLVFQLLEVLPGLKPLVEDCIDSDRDLISNLWDVQKVTRKLFIEPLNTLHLAKPDHVCPPLMVIDGLDECQDHAFQCNSLRIFARAILEVPYPFRLLIATRPEDHLVKFFDQDAVLQKATVHRYNLSDDPDADCDIYDFFEQQLEEIKCTHPLRANLPTGWPGEEVLVNLVDKSSQHFIYASTVVEYIQSPKHSPEERLRIVLGLSPPPAKLDRPFLQLDFLYFSIFQTLGKDHLQGLHSVLGLRRVIDDSSNANEGFFQWQNGSEFLFLTSSHNPGYRTPLYIIETLLKIRPGGVALLLGPLLRSLVYLDDCDVRVLHKSLFDYLLDWSRSGEFHLNLSVPHWVVTKYIVENWESFQNYPFTGLTQLTNILTYHMKASGLDSGHIPSLIRSKGDFSNFEPLSAHHPIGTGSTKPVYHHIPDSPGPAIGLGSNKPAYHHIPDSQQIHRPAYHPIGLDSTKPAYRIPDSQQIHNPVKPEVLPVLRSGIHSHSEAIDTLSDKLLVPSQTECDQQAWSIKYNPDVGPLSMTFARTFVHDETLVYSVRFSPDGHYLSIGLGPDGPRTGNGKVIIYDVISGTPVTRQDATHDKEFDTAITSVWNITRNHIRNAFVGHSGAVTCLDYSPDGRFLVSASLDGSIRIWNMRDGHAKVLIKNAFYFYSVKFSQNMRYVAAANIDKVLRIWEVRTGRLVDWWIGNTAAVNSIAFTPNCMGLVSGSWDKTVKYWDVGSLKLFQEAPADRQREVLTFVGHTDQVFSVAVSPDGHWVLSGSRDGSTSIWDTYDGTQQCTLQGSQGAITSVDFSPAGTYLAIGSSNGCVSLWKYEQKN